MYIHTHTSQVGTGLSVRLHRLLTALEVNGLWMGPRRDATVAVAPRRPGNSLRALQTLYYRAAGGANGSNGSNGANGSNASVLREVLWGLCVGICICLCIDRYAYIYIYIYIDR